MNDEQLNLLVDKAKWLRLAYLDMVVKGGQGHIPSGFSMAEILTTLYYSGILNYKFGVPDYIDRDRVIISKGHAAPILYPILAEIGYFDEIELSRFTKNDGVLSMYPDPKRVCEWFSGAWDWIGFRFTNWCRYSSCGKI